MATKDSSKDRAGTGKAALFHVNCPFTRQVQCYCSEGASMALPGAEKMTPVEQAALANKAKEMYDMWLERGRQAQTAMQRQAQEQQGWSAAEVMLPRMYRNPRSIDQGNDTPVRIRGTLITRAKAAAQLEVATAEAHNAIVKAAQLASFAGLPFQPPPDFSVDPGLLQPAADMKVLEELASGVMVEAAERGNLSLQEQQQLLGLSAKAFHDLCAIQAAAKNQKDAMVEQAKRIGSKDLAKGPGAQQAGPGGDSAQRPGNARGGAGAALIRPEELTRSLVGRMLLMRQPGQDARWLKVQVVDFDPNNGMAKMSFPGFPQILSLDLLALSRERHLAWPDMPQEGLVGAGAPQGSQQLMHMQPSPAAAAAQDLPASIQRSSSGLAQPGPRTDMYGSSYTGVTSPQGSGMAGRMMSSSSGHMGMGPPGGPRGMEAPAAIQPIVARLIAMGPKAYGAHVEITLLATGQMRRGVVSMSYPAMAALGVVIGNVTIKLNAVEELKTYTARLVPN